MLPRSMRLDVPKFLGDDPERWIFAITEYFSLLNTPADQRLQTMGFNLEGVAAEWFRWMSQNGLITTWDRFMESVKTVLGRQNTKIYKGLCQNCPYNRCSFEAIAKKEKEHIVKKKTNDILPLQSELASPKIKGSLDVDDDIGVDEVVGGGEALGVGEDDDSSNVATDRGDDTVESGDISILNYLVTEARVLSNCDERSVQRMSKCSLTRRLIKKSNSMFIPYMFLFRS
ncbi:hypothetical protein Tco_1522204 [Tanacetum coccineum]